MSREAVFKKAVEDLLPAAIPVELDKLDDFTIGKVLVYTKKPRKLIPMRKQGLEFTGWSIDSLLAEGQDISISTAKNYLFDSGKSVSSLNLKVNLEADLSFPFFGSIDAKGGEDKVLDVMTDFGKVTHITSNLVTSVINNNLHLKVDHPIVQKAMDHGGVMFLIHTIYESAHFNMSVKLSKDISESSGEEVKVKVKEGISEGVDDKHAYNQVLNRDQPTSLAYLVMKVCIDSDGRVSTKLKTCQSHKLEVREDCTDGSVFRLPGTRKRHEPYKDWVVIELKSNGGTDQDCVTQTIVSDKAAAAAGRVNAKTETSVSSSSTSPISEQTVRKEEPLQAALPAIPSSSPAKSAKAPTESAKPANSGGVEPEVVPVKTTSYDLDEHFLYSLKDFQPFESKTYYGVLDEIRNWVGPFRDNTKLQDALTVYIKPPQSYERLNDLSSYFMELGEALRSSKTLPPNKHKEIEPIIAALSKDSEKKLDEISSVIVISEAGDDFPNHIVGKIIGLEADKRATLTELILETPYEAETHAFPDKSPYTDRDLKPIISRMGYKILPGTSNLQYTRRVIEEEEDLLTAALILLVATEK